jgi:hypothetical protein
MERESQGRNETHFIWGGEGGKNKEDNVCRNFPGFGLVVLVSWDGVRLSTLGTSVTNLPIVPALDDR